MTAKTVDIEFSREGLDQFPQLRLIAVTAQFDILDHRCRVVDHSDDLVSVAGPGEGSIGLQQHLGQGFLKPLLGGFEAGWNRRRLTR